MRESAVRQRSCTVVVLLALACPQWLRAADDGGAPLPDATAELQQIEDGFRQVIAAVAPSVVGLRVQRRYLASLPPGSPGDGGATVEQLVAVNGSGAVIDSAGLILTNEHVVQAAHSIEVLFHDGQKLSGTVVAADPRGDLAVLKVERGGLTPVRFADWSQVARGQWALALGNPYGLGSSDGNLSVSIGVIANLNRRLPGLGEVDDRFYGDMIQTTAAIHPGCSGGPLFNVRGEMVGLVTAMHTRAPADEGVGFAIPMTPARRRMIDQLKSGKPLDYGYLGLTVRSAEPQERQAAGLGPQAGAVVQEVDPRGPAAQAGVREGDLIVRVGDQIVEGPASLAEVVGLTAPGTQLPVEICRGSQRLTVRATVQRREVSRVSWMRGDALLWRGMRLTELTTAARRRMEVNGAAVGVLVIDVVEGSPAQRAAIQIGDVIEGVADAGVRDLSEFQARVRGEKGPVRVRVRARGELLIPP